MSLSTYISLHSNDWPVIVSVVCSYAPTYFSAFRVLLLNFSLFKLLSISNLLPDIIPLEVLASISWPSSVALIVSSRDYLLLLSKFCIYPWSSSALVLQMSSVVNYPIMIVNDWEIREFFRKQRSSTNTNVFVSCYDGASFSVEISA